jgi:hypothetical protein
LLVKKMRTSSTSSQHVRYLLDEKPHHENFPVAISLSP